MHKASVRSRLTLCSRFGKFSDRRSFDKTLPTPLIDQRSVARRFEEEACDLVGGGATEIGGDWLRLKEGLYGRPVVTKADHLCGKVGGRIVEKEISGEIETGDKAMIHTEIGLHCAAEKFGLAVEVGLVGVTVNEIPCRELLVGLLADLSDLLSGKRHLTVSS